MQRISKMLILSILILFSSFYFFCSLSFAQTQIVTQWAKSVISYESGSDSSGANSVAVDSSGNIYTAGYIVGTSNFGNNITVTGAYSGNNIALMKYDASGVVQWAKSVTVGLGSSIFNSVTIDSSGNVYAVGSMSGTDAYNFGNGVAVAGTYSGNNILLVKYDASGNAQWAKSVTVGSGNSVLNSVIVDSSGNIYIAGSIAGMGTYGFGNSVSVAGTYSGNNILLVKYDASGNAQWAKSVTAGLGNSMLNSVTVDSSGNIYVVGSMDKTNVYNFGDNITAAGTSSSQNVVLVKYNASGSAQWAKSVTAGSGNSVFDSVDIDYSGDIYAVGAIDGVDAYNFGNDVIATGTSSIRNVILVKYNASGSAQWAKSVTTGIGSSRFCSIITGSNKDIYVAGNLYKNDTYGFGNNIAIVGTNPSSNPVLVNYDNSGNAWWAGSVIDGPNVSNFKSVVVDSNGNVYAVGLIYGTGTYNFGNNATVTVASSEHSFVLVKYKASSTDSGESDFSSIKASSSVGSTEVSSDSSSSIMRKVSSSLSEDNSISITVTDISKTELVNTIVEFTAEDFINSFNSKNGGCLKKIKIIRLPNFGSLRLSGIDVVTNQEIPVENLDNLAFIPDTDRIGTTDFGWRGSDGTSYSSNIAKVNINIKEHSESLAWIAGVVVPVVAIIATVGVCVFQHEVKKRSGKMPKQESVIELKQTIV